MHLNRNTYFLFKIKISLVSAGIIWALCCLLLTYITGESVKTALLCLLVSFIIYSIPTNRPPV